MTRPLRRALPATCYILLLCSLIALGLAPARFALAAGPTCTVGTGGGASYTTVQAAVDDTSCAAIEVAAGTYTQNISIGRSVTIHGAGAASTILDGGQAGRVLNIPAPAAQVQIQNVTIQHGAIPDSGRGSAISNSGGLALSNSIVTDNWAGLSTSGNTIL